MEDSECIEALIRFLKPVRRLLVFTGAGMSTGSGIPDFRGPNGVWKRRQPVYYDDFMAREDARLEHWDYKLESWPAFRDARPNEAHRVLAEWESAGRLEGLVTQNIDGLHQKGGLRAEALVELHGSNAEVECQSCGRRSDPDPVFLGYAERRAAPRCECGGWLKPATISFGQSLRAADLEQADAWAMACDAVMSLGSTLSVTPAALVPLQAARRGVPYAVLNRGETDHDGRSEVTLRLEGDVVALLPPAMRTVLERGA